VLAFCERARRGERCLCRFDLELIALDLEDVGLERFSEHFDDAIDAEELSDLTDEILEELEKRQGGEGSRLQRELHLMRRLARQGSGIKPDDED
jgi:uncharacterized membrane protein YcjF (UPF0283 family)